jgi:hypothetical protein
MGIIRHAFTEKTYKTIEQYVMDKYGTHYALPSYLKKIYNGEYDVNGWGGVSFETEKEYTWFLLKWA